MTIELDDQTIAHIKQFITSLETCAEVSFRLLGESLLFLPKPCVASYVYKDEVTVKGSSPQPISFMEAFYRLSSLCNEINLLAYPEMNPLAMPQQLLVGIDKFSKGFVAIEVPHRWVDRLQKTLDGNFARLRETCQRQATEWIARDDRNCAAATDFMKNFGRLVDVEVPDAEIQTHIIHGEDPLLISAPFGNPGTQRALQIIELINALQLKDEKIYVNSAFEFTPGMLKVRMRPQTIFGVSEKMKQFGPLITELVNKWIAPEKTTGSKPAMREGDAPQP